MGGKAWHLLQCCWLLGRCELGHLGGLHMQAVPLWHRLCYCGPLLQGGNMHHSMHPVMHVACQEWGIPRKLAQRFSSVLAFLLKVILPCHYSANVMDTMLM